MREQARVVKDRGRIAAIGAAREQDHIGTLCSDIIYRFFCELERPRANHFRAGAQRRGICGFDGEAGNQTDHGHPQPARGTARSEHETVFQRPQIVGSVIEQPVSFVHGAQRLEQAFAHVGVDRGRPLAATDHFGGAKIHSNGFGVRAAEIDEEG